MLSPEDFTDQPQPFDFAEQLSTLRAIPTRRGQSLLTPVDDDYSGLFRQSLPFVALTVGIDNPTNKWFFLSGENRYIPPFLYGARWKLLSGSNMAQGSWTPPPGGANSGVADLANEIRLMWSADDLPELEGLTLVISALTVTGG